ncbi:hypothetical protein QTO30_08925 [Yoonia sp. GPGPB17]|uniref:hypothetical protein n=1 Tax=Yoonia sp. GPGPB17 TaxID=3026147 RepID=UPI0030BE1977
MTPAERYEWCNQEEERLLLGGYVISEWATLMSYEAHTCFTSGADISTIILAASTCETYLQSELGHERMTFADLIDASGLEDDLQFQLHTLRRKRNGWVHPDKVRTSKELGCYSEAYTPELLDDAKHSYSTMLRTLFSFPLV